MNNADILVLIPSYNEEKKVVGVAAAAKKQGFSVLVVDDGSIDGTVAALRAAGINCLPQKPNAGKGAALRKGFKKFLEGAWSAVIAMDADGQHDPAELTLFVKALDGGESFVVGNRMHTPGAMPPLRLNTNRCMSWLLSRLAGQRVPDSQCGYRAFTRETLSRLDLSSDHFEIESEMILDAARQGIRIVSVPIRSVYEDKKSHIRPVRDTVRFFSFLARNSKKKK